MSAVSHLQIHKKITSLPLKQRVNRLNDWLDKCFLTSQSIQGLGEVRPWMSAVVHTVSTATIIIPNKALIFLICVFNTVSRAVY